MQWSANNLDKGGKMKKFKTESQRVLDIMINSIYTNREIFLRELLSNASDAIDKLYYKSLRENLGLSQSDFNIRVEIAKDKKQIKIIDNGIGMGDKELESNLGVIARSDSLEFKKLVEAKDDINIIGQFGVGFYSAFMVSSKVEVLSRAYGSDDAYLWTSSGVQGYSIDKAEKASHGTEITLTIKDDTDEDKYSEFLAEYRIKNMVKKYSDYIRYPIKMNVEKNREVGEGDDKKWETYRKDETLNSMIPIWKKQKSKIKQEEYNDFYKDTFYDYQDPLKVINTSVEGAVSYNAVLFIPAKTPMNYYSKGYEKGLKLYNGGIMIMEKCGELLPDYFSFVKGVVDSDLTLNISRETIQHNHQLKKIGSNIEKKISDELTQMLKNDRDNYDKFYAEFGLQLKYGVYEGWGANKDKLQDLLLFHSLIKDKMITLAEYVEGMGKEQKFIYYATGKSKDSIKSSPQAEKILEAGYDILCFTDDVDEFAIKIMRDYDKKEFKSISSDDVGIKDNEETKEGDKDKELLEYIKEELKDKVAKVKLSNRLKTHPVCLSSEGELSIEMEKVLSAMPSGESVTAQKVLEINANHPIYNKLLKLYEEDKEQIKPYANILLTQAKLIEGLSIDNPAEYSELVCKLLS